MDINSTDWFSTVNNDRHLTDWESLPFDHPVILWANQQGYVDEDGTPLIEVNDMFDNWLNILPQFGHGWSLEPDYETGLFYEYPDFPGIYTFPPEN